MKSLLLLSAFLCTTLSATAQVYQPFPTNNAYWRVHHNEASNDRDLQFYVTGGDTILGGIKHTKVFVRYAALPPLPLGQIYTPKNRTATKPDEYTGAFYEQNKRMYYANKWDSISYLYFDFNISVGDSVHSFDPYLTNNIVISIDSVKVNSNYRKRYKCSSIPTSLYSTSYVIEGIGSQRGSPFELTNGQNYPHLHCFTNSQGTYTLDTFKCTYIFPYGTPTGINNTTAKKETNIYPNPFSNQLTVDADAAYIKLTDAMGKVVTTQLGNNKTINTSALPAGLYILTLHDDYGNVTERRKLIKE